ncbi:glycosyltransferase family 2 protein [Pontibaca salina]|uniref:Glycosyltransferase n=1 Tax=Pontibaca salina TaxID=2795731 RepID=A0A934M050_9RHOB|nr:hypothetical protein [Pontibaca salina]MBI6628301.1 hypothetical protein [Pontibaca salina]
MKNLIPELARALADWAAQCRSVSRNEPLTIGGLDRSNSSRALDSMFFVDGIEHISPSGTGPVEFTCFEKLNTGTLRNSFYPEVFLRHSGFEHYRLHLELTGSFALKIKIATPGQPVSTLLEKVLSPKGTDTATGDGTARYGIDIDIDLRRDVPKNARLFWSVTALEDGAMLHNGAWRALAPKSVPGRMLVVLRTFGRTADILAMLESAQRQAATDNGYARMLRNTFFMILDTSTGIEAADYDTLKHLNSLNSFVFRGPNMGGGGNMSQALLALSGAVKASGVDVGELLLLDDDLLISLESLRRHWAGTLMRTDSTIFTLPVFMKSQPRKMWEDGAFWGRFLGRENLPERNAIAPRLLRHNLEFNGFDHLDDMAGAHYPEYCTFIFLSLPYSRFRELGYPAAFFLRGDDIEYSLRNRAEGGRTMSNPNLAVWHEPAHSYAQEYMSIAHGMMINMAYGQEKVDDFLAFFQQRALAHLSVGDACGLELYGSVLRDVLGCNVFLEPGFSDHYLTKLQAFKAFDGLFECIPDEVLNTISQGAAHNGQVVGRFGFLYMPTEGHPDLERVILENPHAETHRVYRPADPQNLIRVNRAASELFCLVDRLAQEFDSVRAHYAARLKATSQQEFWLQEMALSSSPGPKVLHLPLTSQKKVGT